MLVMRRRIGDAIRIGDDVEIRILSVQGNKVKIGIKAPRSVAISAQEIDMVRSENLAASQACGNSPEVVAHLLQIRTTKEKPEKTGAMADQKREC